MFKHFLDNKLNSSNQSGFKRSDSWINQLIAVTHDIFKGFNDGLEVKGVFLAISKPLDKVWHKGNEICGNILQLLIGLLDSRKEQV